jgi:hypothetical protein
MRKNTKEGKKLLQAATLNAKEHGGKNQASLTQVIDGVTCSERVLRKKETEITSRQGFGF